MDKMNKLEDMVELHNTMCELAVGDIFEASFPNKRFIIMRISESAFNNSNDIINN